MKRKENQKDRLNVVFKRFFVGAGNGTRTRGLLITNELLYQLSYTSKQIYTKERITLFCVLFLIQ